MWPFEDWLRLAVTRFHILPQAFWNMSVKDWLTLMQRKGASPLTRAGLKTLRDNYPDKDNE